MDYKFPSARVVGIPGIGAALAPQLGQASAFGSTSAPHLGHFTGPLSTVGGLKHMVRPLCAQGRVVVVRRLPDAPCKATGQCGAASEAGGCALSAGTLKCPHAGRAIASSRMRAVFFVGGKLSTAAKVELRE